MYLHVHVFTMHACTCDHRGADKRELGAAGARYWWTSKSCQEGVAVPQTGSKHVSMDGSIQAALLLGDRK